MTQPFSICVYCASRIGQRAEYSALAQALGTALGQRGWQLVYGGGHVGLMGRLADATLAAGGRVIGVIPQALMQREVGHRTLTELHVVATMHDRKRLMAEHCDAFLALPGGIGTLEELFEAWTWRHLGYHARPIGLLDCAGFWPPLLAFLQRGVDEGFMDRDQMAMLSVDDQIERLLDTLYAARSQRPGSNDLMQGV